MPTKRQIAQRIRRLEARAAVKKYKERQLEDLAADLRKRATALNSKVQEAVGTMNLAERRLDCAVSLIGEEMLPVDASLLTRAKSRNLMQRIRKLEMTKAQSPQEHIDEYLTKLGVKDDKELDRRFAQELKKVPKFSNVRPEKEDVSFETDLTDAKKFFSTIQKVLSKFFKARLKLVKKDEGDGTSYWDNKKYWYSYIINNDPKLKVTVHYYQPDPEEDEPFDGWVMLLPW